MFLLFSSYSSRATSSGIWLFNTTTPAGFDPIGVALTILLTGPFWIVGAGFSLGGRLGSKPKLANAGLIVSALYAVLLTAASLSAFS
ncbi:MAG: hypothetical protein JKY65_04425 [Planctomycetes bacterium]|nr:hypothetical protein [Planctomycetota bacterium]